MTKRRKQVLCIVIVLCICIIFGVYDHQKRVVTQELCYEIEQRNTKKVEDILEYATPEEINQMDHNRVVGQLLSILRWGGSEYPINEAVYFGEYKMTKLLLEAGAATNVRSPIYDDTPLTTVLDDGEDSRYRIATLLLEYGADPNVSNENGDTPYSLAKEERVDDSKKTKQERKRFLKILKEKQDK